MAKEEEQKMQDLLAARAKKTAAPVVFASDPVAQGYMAIPLDDTEVETPVVQSPGVQKPSTDPSTWDIVDMTTVKPQATTATPAYKLPPRPTLPAGYGDYGWFDDFASQYFEKPLTPEERARRERAAYISSGVANLGSAIGALGNMFYARGGAPAQKLSTMPDVDQKVSSFRQYADKVRNDYLNSRLAVQKAKEEAFDKEDKRWLSGYSTILTDAYRREQLRIRQEEVDRRKAKDILLAQAQDAEIEGKKELARLRRAQADRYEALTPYEVQRILAQANASNASAYASTMRGNQYAYKTGPESVTTVTSGSTKDGGTQTRTSTKSYGGSNVGNTPGNTAGNTSTNQGTGSRSSSLDNRLRRNNK